MESRPCFYIVSVQVLESLECEIDDPVFDLEDFSYSAAPDVFKNIHGFGGGIPSCLQTVFGGGSRITSDSVPISWEVWKVEQLGSWINRFSGTAA